MRQLLTVPLHSRAPRPLPTPRAGRRPPLRLERLEDRTVLDVVPPTDPLLFTPAPEDAPLAMHINAFLTIVINHTPLTIPAGIGLTPEGDEMPLHTHNTSGTIDIESPILHQFTLGDFFSVWGQPFSNQQVLGFRADAHHAIRMTVDGFPSTSFESQILWNGEQIVVSYVHVASNPLFTHPPSHLHAHGHHPHPRRR
jgi:hypothetical protein